MKKLLIILALVILANYVHAQLKKFTVEIPQKPKYLISDSIQSFTLLNRALTPEFQNYNKDSLQISFYKQNFNIDKVILDSIAADTTLKVLGELLFDSDRYDVVIPLERNVYRALPYTQTNDPLSWEYVEAVCDEFQTDALIVLENIAMKTSTNYNTKTEFGEYFEFEKTYYASITYFSRAHWRIYYPAKKQIIVDYKSSQDTLFWEDYQYKLITVFNNLPKIKDAAIETGIKAAISFSDLIAPKWVEVSRYYYIVGDTAIDNSIKVAAEGKWEDALNNWLLFEDKGSSSTRSKVLLNIALAYEMNGDIDKAIDKVKKSQSLYYREVTNFYLNQLYKRKKG
ncbi:MAG: hypothetical protein KA807_11060 [Prolixibacteraceae bacterium]|nr:hypothetical protein [Prolixibacteraceae bacterium]